MEGKDRNVWQVMTDIYFSARSGVLTINGLLIWTVTRERNLHIITPICVLDVRMEVSTKS